MDSWLVSRPAAALWQEEEMLRHVKAVHLASAERRAGSPAEVLRAGNGGESGEDDKRSMHGERDIDEAKA